MDREEQDTKLNVIARILKMRVRDGRKNYLVDWNDSRKECQWIEPDRSDQELKQLIEQFHREATLGQSYSSSMLENQTLSQFNQSQLSSMEDENSQMEEQSLEKYNRIAEEENFFTWASRFVSRLQARIAGFEVRKNKSLREVERFVSFFKRGNLICLIAVFVQDEERHMMVSVKEAKKYFSRQLNEFFRHFVAQLNEKEMDELEMQDCKTKVEYLAEMLGFWWKALRPDEAIEERRREVVPREKYQPTYEELKEFLQFTVREKEQEKKEEGHSE